MNRRIVIHDRNDPDRKADVARHIRNRQFRERYANDPEFRADRLARVAAHRRVARKAVLATNARYYRSHRKAILAQKRGYYVANREKKLAYEAAKRKSNRETINARRRELYAQRKAAR